MRKSFARLGFCSRRPRLRITGLTRLLLLPAIATATVAPMVLAQVVPGSGADIGTLGADRARVLQITGRAPDTIATDSSARISPVYPTVRIAWNSDLPSGGNDGALWAGRGLSMSITGGATYSRPTARGRLQLTLAPEITYSGNRPFPIFPGR